MNIRFLKAYWGHGVAHVSTGENRSIKIIPKPSCNHKTYLRISPIHVFTCGHMLASWHQCPARSRAMDFFSQEPWVWDRSVCHRWLKFKISRWKTRKRTEDMWQCTAIFLIWPKYDSSCQQAVCLGLMRVCATNLARCSQSWCFGRNFHLLTCCEYW